MLSGLRSGREDPAPPWVVLDVDRQEVQVLQAELANVRQELDQERARAKRAGAGLDEERARAQRAAAALVEERARTERAAAALDEERARAEQAIAGAERAERKAAVAAAHQESQRQTVETLRAELSASREALHPAQAQHSGDEEAVSVSASEPVPGSAAEPVTPGEPVGLRLAWDAASQRALSASLAGVLEWRTVLEHVVKTLGPKGGWDATVAWCPDEPRPWMKCVAMWTGDAEALTAFETRTWQHRRSPSTGFGRARSQTAPTCLVSLHTAEDVLLRAAAAEGLSSAVLVPIGDGVEIVAMLELLSRATTPPDSELLLSLEGIALQLGAISRVLSFAAEPHWRIGRL